jgi:hypothetical protein
MAHGRLGDIPDDWPRIVEDGLLEKESNYLFPSTSPIREEARHLVSE